ncbi:MAG: hypothetical protein MUC84_04320 [Solirubrobacteraceae bacterium]|jgi:hypothetical protein|nr:hypothetical protein [Solirubrobacteraceae bacterium]
MRTGTRNTLGIALAGAIALAGLGCGSGEKHENRLRPPVPLLLSASITPARITLSPARTGAGPVTLIVTNLTGSSQQVTFESDTLPGSVEAVRQQTAPINPRDTATLKARLTPGTYRLRVGGDLVTPARLAVGPKRPSSQNDLMLP